MAARTQRVDGRWLHTGLGQTQLESARLFHRRFIAAAVEVGREHLYSTEVRALLIGYEPARVNLFEHTLAQQLEALDPQDRAPTRHLCSIK
jgi:hypothetical protein